MTSPANRLLLPGLLALLVLNAVVFWPVLTFDFVRWDDDINITDNTLFTDPWSDSLWARFFAADHALRFKPLHWLIGRGLYATAGLNPAAWHAFNLFFHVTAAILFYFVLRQVLRLLGLYTPASAVRVELTVLFGAALWSIHPLRAEAVAWATASTYPLSAVCMLAAFACYLRAYTTGARRRWLVVAWVLTVLAYASYPVTATFAFWLIAVHKWLLPRGASDTGASSPPASINWLKHACFLTPAVLAVAITLWSRYATPGVFLPAPSVETVGSAARVIMALASLSYLAGSLVWPVNLTPNMPPLTSTAFSPGVLALAVVAGVALVLTWRIRHRRPLLALTCVGFAALSLPCLGLTERPTWPVDRYSYIAQLPLIGAAAIWLAMPHSILGRIVNAGKVDGVGAPSPRFPEIAGRGRPGSTLYTYESRIYLGLVAVAMLLIVTCARAARTQTMIWRDSASLFTHMSRHPDFDANPRQQGHIFLLWASHELANARPDSAADLSHRARQVYVAATQNAVATGDYPEALALLSHVERYFGLTPILRREKGAWLLRENRTAEATRELRTAAGVLPNDERARALLAEAEALAGRPDAPRVQP